METPILISITSPFSVAITLTIISMSFAIGLLISGYGVAWRLFLKPLFQAKDQQIRATKDEISVKDEHIRILRDENSFLNKKMEEQKASELSAYIQSLKEIIEDNQTKIDRLNNRINKVGADHSKEQEKLKKQIISLMQNKKDLIYRIKRAEEGKINVSSFSATEIIHGIMLEARNLSLVPVNVEIFIKRGGLKDRKITFNLPPVSNIPDGNRNGLTSAKRLT